MLIALAEAAAEEEDEAEVEEIVDSIIIIGIDTEVMEEIILGAINIAINPICLNPMEVLRDRMDCDQL